MKMCFCQISKCVFISYVDQLAPSWERQEQLDNQYYFQCVCERCSDASLVSDDNTYIFVCLINLLITYSQQGLKQGKVKKEENQN